MAFMDLARARYSVRAYSDKPIEKEKLDRVLEAARIAPTGHNNQPFKIYVAQSEEVLGKLNEQTPCIFGANTVLVFVLDKSAVWENRLEAGVNSGVQDVSIAATHAMLEAHDQGLGTCWVNMFSPTNLDKALGLPESEHSILIMPIGYPGENAHPAKLHAESKGIDELVRYI